MLEDYKTGYIYKLVCSETGDCYYGSTRNDPVYRYKQHLKEDNCCSSKCLKEPTMHILEIKEGISKLNLELIEKHYILNNTCINKIVTRRKQKERYNHKKKSNPNYLKELYQKNGGIMRNLRTRKKCECGGVYIQRNLKNHLRTEKHKKYINNI